MKNQCEKAGELCLWVEWCPHHKGISGRLSGQNERSGLWLQGASSTSSAQHWGVEHNHQWGTVLESCTSASFSVAIKCYLQNTRSDYKKFISDPISKNHFYIANTVLLPPRCSHRWGCCLCAPPQSLCAGSGCKAAPGAFSWSTARLPHRKLAALFSVGEKQCAAASSSYHITHTRLSGTNQNNSQAAVSGASGAGSATIVCNSLALSTCEWQPSYTQPRLRHSSHLT